VENHLSQEDDILDEVVSSLSLIKEESGGEQKYDTDIMILYVLYCSVEVLYSYSVRSTVLYCTSTVLYCR
jgi:hypothetical protein